MDECMKVDRAMDKMMQYLDEWMQKMDECMKMDRLMNKWIQNLDECMKLYWQLEMNG